MTAPSITIIQLDPYVPLDRFSGWLNGARLRNIPAWQRPSPPLKEVGHGLVVIGGRASADDPELHKGALKGLVVEAVDRGLPVLGIRAGHQLLVEAFGGELQVNDVAEAERGPVDVSWQPAAHADPVVGRVASMNGTLFPAFHDQAVTRLPQGSIDLAGSEAYPHQAIRIGSAVSMQFHPGASPDLIASWAELHGEDPLPMRRSMRLVDDTLSQNGRLVGQGFARAAREYAESGADRDCRAA